MADKSITLGGKYGENVFAFKYRGNFSVAKSAREGDHEITIEHDSKAIATIRNGGRTIYNDNLDGFSVAYYSQYVEGFLPNAPRTISPGGTLVLFEKTSYTAECLRRHNLAGMLKHFELREKDFMTVSVGGDGRC